AAREILGDAFGLPDFIGGALCGRQSLPTIRLSRPSIVAFERKSERHWFLSLANAQKRWRIGASAMPIAAEPFCPSKAKTGRTSNSSLIWNTPSIKSNSASCGKSGFNHVGYVHGN